MHIWTGRNWQTRYHSRVISQHDHALRTPCARRPRNVKKVARVRDRELSCSGNARRSSHTLDHSYGFATHLTAAHIERNREYNTASGVQQMTGWNVSSRASSLDNRLPLTRLERLNNNTSRIPP